MKLLFGAGLAIIINVTISIAGLLLVASIVGSLIKLAGNGCSETWGIDKFPLIKTDLFCAVGG